MADETVVVYDGNGKELHRTTYEQTADVTNDKSLRTKARAALAANATYLALATPTAAQNAAQVKRLTQECNALIRLALGALDTDDA